MGGGVSSLLAAPPVRTKGEVLSTKGSDLAAVMLYLYDCGPEWSSWPPANWLRPLSGCSTFHQLGVRVYGVEWSFTQEGVTWCRPLAGECRTLCKTEHVGTTLRSRHEVLELTRALWETWKPGTFDAQTRNSGHFAAAFCQRLGVGPLADWVEDLQNLPCPPRQEVVMKLCWFGKGFCCLDDARGTVIDDQVEIANPEAMERFSKWTETYVDTLKCLGDDNKFSEAEDAAEQDDSSVRRPSPLQPREGGEGRGRGETKEPVHTPQRPAYHLIRERWLRNRRGKSRLGGAFSVMPPRCCPTDCAMTKEPAAACPMTEEVSLLGFAAGDPSTSSATFATMSSTPSCFHLRPTVEGGDSVATQTPESAASCPEVTVAAVAALAANEEALSHINNWIDSYVEAVATSPGRQGSRSPRRGARNGTLVSNEGVQGVPAVAAAAVGGGIARRPSDLEPRLGPQAPKPAWIGRTPELLRQARELGRASRSHSAPPSACSGRRVAHL